MADIQTVQNPLQTGQPVPSTANSNIASETATSDQTKISAQSVKSHENPRRKSQMNAQQATNKQMAAPSKDANKRNGTNGTGNTVANMTAWASPSTNITQTKAIQGQSKDPKVTSPSQSVAIIAGRKYIMVPKMSKMNAPSTADSDPINGVNHSNDSHSL